MALAVLAAVAASAAPAGGEQASSEVRRLQAGFLDAGGLHSCALLRTGAIRCWGAGSSGQLGYGNPQNIGDDETPVAAGPVDVGPGRTATAIAAGSLHTCALLDTGQVRCWGDNATGQLGYGNQNDVGDDETPTAAGLVNLGTGRTATAITAGEAHTCALLDTGQVRCWGEGGTGSLGHGNENDIGDDETPAAAGPVNLGPARTATATAISAGRHHTCALLATGQVHCWGFGKWGRLGYGNENDVGDDETPAAAGPVNLGLGRTATAIAAGGSHTCALLDTGRIRCWGFGQPGSLGYGNENHIGDDETPAAAGPVDLGPGRTAIAVTAGGTHTCAVLDTGQIHCWGTGSDGQLGYGNVDQSVVGDNEGDTPAEAGPVNLGPERTATAVTAGDDHTCALLDTGQVRCWGNNATGQLGYGNTDDVGLGETPAAAGPVNLGDTLFGRLADLSLALAAPGTATVDQPFDATLTVRNDGPDATAGVTVSAPAPANTTVMSATPGQGTYNAITGEWLVGALASGTTATLSLSLQAASAGDRTLFAEIVGSSVGDFDSMPNNGLPHEDDRTSATTSVMPAPVSTPAPLPPPPPPPAQPAVRGTLSLSAKPRRGARRVKVRGTLALPAGTPAATCAGKVTLTLKRGKRRLARRSASLRPPKTGSTCTFSTTLKLERRLRARQKLRLTGSLAATNRLAATTTTARRTVRR